MAVPKKRHTKSRTNKRRMSIFLKKPTISACPKCKKDFVPHRACVNCGFYKGREILDVFKKMTKKEKKTKEKEIEQGEKDSLDMQKLSQK